MKIATAAYPLDMLGSWAEYAAKLSGWVADAAAQGADLAVFPEYGAMELATLRGPEVAGESGALASCGRCGDGRCGRSPCRACHAPRAARSLARRDRVFDPALGARPVNRATLYAPTGARAHQDKQIMTRFEREEWHVAPGGPLRLFDTALGTIGILICYDSEFPLLGRALCEAELLLVPSCTEALTGYWRVRIGAMARALEAQCISVMASTVGAAAWSPAIDTNTGMGGIFCPPDTGFPATGVIAEGVLNRPGWTVAEVDLARVAHVRADGVVLNRRHWADQAGRDGAATIERLR